jgi:2-polyprenyl-6-methoxyphenol hydroxylase-like FAD-dependent oxidoreductase
MSRCVCRSAQRNWIRSAQASIRADTIQTPYGAPLVFLHRATLLAALARVAGRAVISTGVEAVSLQENADCVLLRTSDGEEMGADTVIGTDGLRSAVRQALLGSRYPRASGLTAYRAATDWSGKCPCRGVLGSRRSRCSRGRPTTSSRPASPATPSTRLDGCLATFSCWCPAQPVRARVDGSPSATSTDIT